MLDVDAVVVDITDVTDVDSAVPGIVGVTPTSHQQQKLVEEDCGFVVGLLWESRQVQLVSTLVRGSAASN